MMAVAMVLGACSSAESYLPDDARTRAADAQVRARWGKGLADLPQETLVLISPHNRNIQQEFEWAFSLDQALRRGRRVRCEWRDVGGGGSAIRKHLTNVLVVGKASSADIDVLWGGGDLDYPFYTQNQMLERLDLRPEILEQIPRELGGVTFYEKDGYWAGSVVSAFGFVYNATMLRRCGVAFPAQWQDLARPELADRITLADPAQSSSAAAAYLTVVRSGKDWPDGWARLLAMLANADRFSDSAGTAASGPLVGTALVAACIDFYGALRVAEAPGEIVYVSPHGQTTFTPDPIAVLRKPPHPELAQEFVNFVLSARGQALWALPVGSPDGPVRNALGRLPIRKDVYRLYGGQFMGGLADPYEAGQSMTLQGFGRKVSFDALRQLVKTAAVDNAQALKAARRRMAAAAGADEAAALRRQFNRLPDNVATLEEMAKLSPRLKDEVEREKLLTQWQAFFAEKYDRIARGLASPENAP